MYRPFYNLTDKPFQITTDPRFLWLGEKHKEAFATLKYGVLDDKGFLLLTGDVGTGKTTLINALVKSLSTKVLLAKIPDPRLEVLDFYRIIASAFAIKKPFQSKGEFLLLFTEFLERAHGAGRQVLLLIDEAQRLGVELLEEIRHLSNIEKEHAKLLNIFFVGQPEFNNILLDRKNRAIRQRITVNYRLEPLSEQETTAYIAHRLKVAGGRSEIFTPQATREVFLFSQGAPRLVNIICDRALLTGYVGGHEQISADIIRECAAELRILPYVDESEGAPPPPRTLKAENIANADQAAGPGNTPPPSAAGVPAGQNGGQGNIELDLSGLGKRRGGMWWIFFVYFLLVILIGAVSIFFFLFPPLSLSDLLQ
ncbi:MAG: ExeA family protein [Thermodesulfobacteriota bacterium]